MELQKSLLEKAEALDLIYRGRVGEKEKQAEMECDERWVEYRKLYDSFVERCNDVLKAIATVANTTEGKGKIKNLCAENGYTRCYIEVVNKVVDAPGPDFYLWADELGRFHGQPVWNQIDKVSFSRTWGVASFNEVELTDDDTWRNNSHKYDAEHVERRIKMLKAFESFDGIEKQFTELLNRELGENSIVMDDPLMAAAKIIY